MASPHTFYPRSPQFKREIGIDLIGESWAIFRANPWPMVWAVLCHLLVAYVPAGLTYVMAFGQMFLAIINNQGPVPQMDIGTQLILQGAIYGASFLGMLFAFPFHVSVTKMYLSGMRGEAISSDDVFFGWRHRLGRTLVIGFIYSIGMYVGFSCCYLPGFIFAGAFLCLVPVLVDFPQLSVSDCLSKSIEIIKPQFWMAVLLAFLGLLIAGLGFLACCVGAFVTYAMWFGLGALAYRNMTTDPPVYAVPGAPAPPPPAEERPRPPE